VRVFHNNCITSDTISPSLLPPPFFCRVSLFDEKYLAKRVEENNLQRAKNKYPPLPCPAISDSVKENIEVLEEDMRSLMHMSRYATVDLGQLFARPQ
jgi:hypothetical protein